MLQTLPDLLEEFCRRLTSGTFDAYLPRPIPHDLDAFVQTIVRSYQESEADEQALIACLPDQGASILLGFAERQAALAVRTKRPSALAEAAVAVGLAAAARDNDREGMLVMPVVWHAAALLGVHQQHLFRSAAGKVAGPGSRALSAFVERKPEDQTLECMGYREGSDKDGFRFVRTW
ncbi:hypothetical protein [uncultured Methylibium sp.]|uniref:hypothetical protein n=1 Tax=uncultured Methylibium sp. TaxID=381093 RepID=UPI0025E96096|nr:hypothetical protein [uncultured Methylibium sp.]